MKYINQREYPDMKYITVTDKPGDAYGTTTTVKSSACGLCSAIMVLDRLYPDREFSFTIEDAVQLSYECKANHGPGTDASIFMPVFAEKFNLNYESTNDIEKLKENLMYGGAAVALVGSRADEGYTAVFTFIEHFICITSLLKDGRFAVLDPNLYDGKFEEADRAGKVQVAGNIVLCPQKILEEDTLKIVRRTEAEPEKYHSKAYHLFSRKF